MTVSVSRSPGITTGTPGGYGVIISAATLPPAEAGGTVSVSAKNASRGAMAVSKSRSSPSSTR
jgi:hypothetical protein